MTELLFILQQVKLNRAKENLCENKSFWSPEQTVKWDTD